MPKLYRPHIPVETQCRVVLRQLGEMFIDQVIAEHRYVPRAIPARSLARLLDIKLAQFAVLLKCDVSDLRLDHDPPLGARPRHRKGLGKKTYYTPDANDPEHLFFRPHGPQFAGSHLIKTNVRGDHGQYPDRVLINRERKRTKKVERVICSRCRRNYTVHHHLCGRCLKVAMKHRDKQRKKFDRWPKGRKIPTRRTP